MPDSSADALQELVKTADIDEPGRRIGKRSAQKNVVGLVLARKGQSDLAISVVKNSVSQVAAFLYPALVLVSLLFAHQLTFALPPVLIAALLVTALAMWQITGDGEAVAFEGWALVAIYVILAVFTLYE